MIQLGSIVQVTTITVRELSDIPRILIEFGVPLKLVRMIKMCLNEMYSKVHIGKHLCDNFLSKMVQNK
jgi:hypothetical protein